MKKRWLGGLLCGAWITLGTLYPPTSRAEAPPIPIPAGTAPATASSPAGPPTIKIDKTSLDNGGTIVVSGKAPAGKPVFIEGLTGANNKFEQFHRDLQVRGYTRPFTGELADWHYPPLDETSRVASLIKQSMGLN